jgi:hypothetical protein
LNIVTLQIKIIQLTTKKIDHLRDVVENFHFISSRLTAMTNGTRATFGSARNEGTLFKIITFWLR